jgi:predicted metal-dependent hydrolase
MPLAESLESRIRTLGLDVPVRVRVSPRARLLSLRLDPTARAVELVLPPRARIDDCLHFVSAHRGWIVARIAGLPPPIRLVEGAVVPVLGVPHRIRRELDAKAPIVAMAEGEIRVRGDPAHLPRRVRDHLTALAKRELGARARVLAARVGKNVTRIGVRDPKSRWGSCSSKGTLSFSWRLVFAPETVIDYVVAHEVAHLVEMNHSPRFWRLVATLAPDAPSARAWLRRHRAELLAYS